MAVRVLLADDERLSREMGCATLRSVGCEVTPAAGGIEALDHCRGGSFDLLVLDLQMPGCDGFEVARRVRRGEAGRSDLRIVALTADDGPWVREGCREAGMDAHVAKPLRADVMREVVGAWFGGGVDALLAQVRGDQALVARLLALFREQSTDLLAAGRRAIARRDAPALDQVAHALKGVLGHVSGGDLVDRVRRIETQARAGDLTRMDGLWGAIEEDVRRLQATLDDRQAVVGSATR
jgi:CheY-like chemotaxis protein